jgi:hypothetical protein
MDAEGEKNTVPLRRLLQAREHIDEPFAEEAQRSRLVVSQALQLRAPERYVACCDRHR